MKIIASENDQTARPLVTVIMPAYNAATTIESSIASVLSQTMENFELLICDDASSDSTFDFLHRVKDSRVRVFRNNVNYGPGASRDRLIAEAKGEWIAFCDADDTWQPERLSALLSAGEINNYAVIFDDIMECHCTQGDMVPWKRLRGPHAFGAAGAAVQIDAAQFIDSKRMLIQPMFSRALLLESGAYHSRHAYGEDSFFLLKLLAKGGCLIYVPSALYMYRITPGSASKNAQRHSLLRDALQATLADFDQQPLVQAALRRKISQVAKSEIYAPFATAIKERRAIDAVRLLVKSPSLMGALLMRGISDLPYHLHRFRHGGFTRGSK